MKTIKLTMRELAQARRAEPYKKLTDIFAEKAGRMAIKATRIICKRCDGGFEAIAIEASDKIVVPPAPEKPTVVTPAAEPGMVVIEASVADVAPEPWRTETLVPADLADEMDRAAVAGPVTARPKHKPKRGK